MAAWAADLAEAGARRRRTPDPPTLQWSGVKFSVPPRRHRHQRAFYRDRLLRLRDLSPALRWPYPRVVSGPEPTDLPAPMVLATFHLGPLVALGGLVERLPGPVCVLLAAGQVVTRRASHVRTHGGEAQSVSAVIEALHILRDGGYALVVVDYAATSRVHETVLGRPVSLAKGAFALARLAQAPLLPLAVRWRGPAVEIVAGEAIAPSRETDMAAALVAWLEDYLRQHPGELSFPLSRALGISSAA